MALPKKGTRSITVQQKTYRWGVSSAGQGMLVVTIQSAGEAGQLIRVYMKADVPVMSAATEQAGDSPLAQERRAIKPSDVEAIIAEAVQQGWEPEKKGTPLSFEWRGDVLFSKGK